MHWTDTNTYWTSIRYRLHPYNTNLLVRLSFSIAFDLKVVSIDRAWHINLVGHLFSDHTLLKWKKKNSRKLLLQGLCSSNFGNVLTAKKSLTERTASNKYITYDTTRLLFKDAVYKTYWTISKLWWCALGLKPSSDSCRSYITRKRAVLHGLLNNWSYTVICAWSTSNASLTYLGPFVR